MLVLTRKQAETIHLGEDIVIKVIVTKKNTVKLGIEAPQHVRVLRGEHLAEKAELTLAHLLQLRHSDEHDADVDAIQVKTA